ncbi:hypothetical protein [Sphingobium yanoikuyae]|uniref:hypothetical protein n=1 Tax=Sphingobium yanoikuyae TaxID=13690 RepID=UPI0028AA972B|nr:hypothetical protein [Sphingobium yanoikuyae]
MIAIGIAAGGSGSAIGWFLMHGYKEEAVFSFLGAIVGAAATVAGAVWLADRTATSASAKERQILIDECTALEPIIERSIAIYDADGRVTGAFKTSVRSLHRAALEVPAIMREALARANTLDFRQRVKLIKAEGAILEFDQFFRDVFSHEGLDQMSDKTWTGVLTHVGKCLKELTDELMRR